MSKDKGKKYDSGKGYTYSTNKKDFLKEYGGNKSILIDGKSYPKGNSNNHSGEGGFGHGKGNGMIDYSYNPDGGSKLFSYHNDDYSVSNPNYTNDLRLMISANLRYDISTPQVVFENDLDQPERNKGVYNLSHLHKAGGWVVQQLAHLNNVRSTMLNGWGQNVFKNIQVLDLSHNGLLGTELSPLCKSLYYQQINFKVLNLSYNKLDSASLGEVLWSIGNKEDKFQHTVESLILSNNQIDDKGAEYLTWHFTTPSLKGTKYIDVSGNPLSNTGMEYFAKAIQNTANDIKILAFRLLNVNTIVEGGKKQSDLFFGSKEEKQAIIKDYLKQAQSNGIDTKNVVVSKNIFFNILNKVKLGGNFLFGWAKCSAVPEDATSFAAGVIVAKTSKKATGIGFASDIAACYFETFDEKASSQEGVQHMLDAGYVTQNDLLGNVE